MDDIVISKFKTIAKTGLFSQFYCLSFLLANLSYFFLLQYELKDLEGMCLRELVKNVDTENAVKTLIMADRYGGDEGGSKDFVMKYISRLVFVKFICTVRN